MTWSTKIDVSLMVIAVEINVWMGISVFERCAKSKSSKKDIYIYEDEYPDPRKLATCCIATSSLR